MPPSSTSTRWSAVPAERPGKLSLRRRQNLVIAVIVLAALMGPLAFFMAAKASSSKVAPPPDDTAPSWVVGFSQAVATDFLAGRPTTLPVAEGVDSTFGFKTSNDNTNPTSGVTIPTKSQGFAYRTIEHHVTETSSIGGVPVYISTFRVTTDQGVFNLEITTVSPSPGVLLLASNPSMTRATLAKSESVQAPAWQDDKAHIDSVPADTKTAVTKWGEAFAADQRDQLRFVAGGGPDGGQYPGLGGFTLDKAEVTSGKASATNPSQAIFRVTLSLTNNDKTFTVKSDYDVLVDSYQTSNAHVVAWGPPGSGETLVPYQNNTAFKPS